MSVIVSIDHSTGDLTQYTTTVTDGGNLSVAAGAALGGSNYGLSCYINDTTAIYGQYVTATNTSGVVRARFYIDPNTLTMAASDEFIVFSIKNSSDLIVSYVDLFYSATFGYRIRSFIRNDAGADTANAITTISDAPHYIEIKVVRATTNVSADGSIQLWIDGISIDTVGSIDNYDRFLDCKNFYFGPSGALDAGTSGTLYLDELVANDDGGEIGPVSSTVTITVAEGNVGTSGDAVTVSFTAAPSILTGKGRLDPFRGWTSSRLLGSTRGLVRWVMLECDECPNGMRVWRDWYNLNVPFAVVYIDTAEGFVAATQDAVTVTFTGGSGIPSVDVAEGFVSTTGDAVTVGVLYPLTVSEGFVTSTGDAVTVSTTANITIAEGFVSTTGDVVTVSGGTLTQTITVAEGFVTSTGDAVTVSYSIPVVSITVSEGFVATSGDVITCNTITGLTVAEGFVVTTGDIVTILLMNLVYPGTRRINYTNSNGSYSAGRRANNYTASPTDYETSVRNNYYVNIRETAEVED
jgi:hypothetical protein